MQHFKHLSKRQRGGWAATDRRSVELSQRGCCIRGVCEGSFGKQRYGGSSPWDILIFIKKTPSSRGLLLLLLLYNTQLSLDITLSTLPFHTRIYLHTRLLLDAIGER